jgi:CBS domain-containing protein
MHDIAEFLRQHPPFEELDEDTLESLAHAVEIEYFAAGTTIFRQGETPMQHVRVVRSGTVELVDRGRVLDLLGEGELFGHPSMLAGLPTGFEARAGEDALCYRLPASRMVPLLARPAGLRYVARSLLARPRSDASILSAVLDPAQRPIGQLLTERRPIICAPATTVREAAERMAHEEAGAALIRLGDGELGILTDHDLRATVVAGDVSRDAPVTAAMSAPAFSVTPDRLGAEVTLEMLERDLHEVAVVSPLGKALGIISDTDLLAAEARTPFALRRAIRDATSAEELRRAAEGLRLTVVTLLDAHVGVAQIGGVIAVVVDALTRRSIEIELDRLGSPPCPFSWIALGSFGRREVVPSSDVDSAILWDDEDDDEGPQDYMLELGRSVAGELARMGFATDPHGASAAKELFVRSARRWRRLIRHSMEHPTDHKGLVVLSLLLDARVVEGIGDTRDVLEELRQLRHRRSLQRLMLQLALSHKPPTGFLRGFVVEGSGEHRGRLDIKEGGLAPITGIARYGGLAAGASTVSTSERLRIAATAGKLDSTQARTLSEAHDLFWRLRLEHQVEQVRGGDEPDDYIDPATLNPLTRRYLRDAFAEVRAVQKTLAAELRHG